MKDKKISTTSRKRGWEKNKNQKRCNLLYTHVTYAKMVKKDKWEREDKGKNEIRERKKILPV